MRLRAAEIFLASDFLLPTSFSGRKGKGRGAMCKLKIGKFVNTQRRLFHDLSVLLYQR